MVPLTKATAYRIEAMESCRLISYKHHIPWTESLIVSMDSPPHWVLDLSVSKYIGDVQKVLREFVFSEPFEEMDELQHYRDSMASLLIRYRRRELSWASFLLEAGTITDCSNVSTHPCEYFFQMLNEFQDADYSHDVERLQLSKIEEQFDSAVRDIMPLYLKFRRFYPKK